MYEICKISITRKIEKGTLTETLRKNLSKKIGVFYYADQMTETEYFELLELVSVTEEKTEEVSEPKEKTEA